MKMQHWSQQKEQAAGYWHLKLLLVLFRIFPPVVLRTAAFPVSAIYYLVSARARTESARFFQRLGVHPRGNRTYRHILSFALSLIDKIESWGGTLAFERIHFQDDDIADLITRLERGEGALLICSHLGNAELLRALASFQHTGVSRNIPVTSVVDFSGTAYFNRMLGELNPESMLHLVSATDISPGTIIDLTDRITAGELVVIAGDRTSARTPARTLLLPFLGADAAFPYGVFFLAALLNAPTYMVFALRRKDTALSPEYTMHVHASNISFDCPRTERDARIRQLAERFVALLEGYCKQHPYQWYNFYDFWATEGMEQDD